MNTGSLVPQARLIDRLGKRPVPDDSGFPDSPPSVGSMGVQGRSSGNDNAAKPGDLQTVVAGRIMRMLRSHDRARLELLSASTDQPR